MKWWLRQESNQRHTELQSVALPTELQSLMAVQTGIEPAISSVTGRRIKPLYHWTTNNNCILYLSWQGIEPFFKYTYLQSRHMVAEVGLEPTTFGLWARRATDCSTPRCHIFKRLLGVWFNYMPIIFKSQLYIYNFFYYSIKRVL